MKLLITTPPEYNLEFQGSFWNLQKRARFMRFYPEMPWNNTDFGKKGTFCQILQRAASHYWMLISSGLFLVHLSLIIWYSVFTPLCCNSYYAINGNMLFFCFLYWFLYFLQYRFFWQSQTNIKKSIFKLQLKLYEDNIPILICCNNQIFIKCFFLVYKRVLILLDAC